VEAHKKCGGEEGEAKAALYDDDVIYFQYDTSTPLRFCAAA
jgi:hypothetical protein